MLHAIIMAGGSGTRFWPASRSQRPKQFLPLAHGKSLIQATVDRVTPVVGAERTWIVTNAAQARALPDVLEGFPSDHVLIEPEARDTAPCAALAAAHVESVDPGATMALMPADHLIEEGPRWQELLQRAAALAADGTSLVTLGIPPTHPSVDYGYIEQAERIDDAAPAAFAVARFTEKPDRATAEHFLASGSHAWNSGIFVWTTQALLAGMDAGNPQLAACTRRMLEAASQGDQATLAAAFRDAPRTSVDYAVMEKAPRVVMLEMDLDWTDLGSFLTLDAVAPRDAAGNVTALLDGARAVARESENCVVYGEGARTVALFGLRDVLVVAVDDAVLVCPKDRAGDLKKLVEQLREGGQEDLL